MSGDGPRKGVSTPTGYSDAEKVVLLKKVFYCATNNGEVADPEISTLGWSKKWEDLTLKQSMMISGSVIEAGNWKFFGVLIGL